MQVLGLGIDLILHEVGCYEIVAKSWKTSLLHFGIGEKMVFENKFLLMEKVPQDLPFHFPPHTEK